VVEGPYGEIARRQNESYVTWVTSGRPFVTLKMAMSLDGKVATMTGDSRWVTADVARADVHRMRAASDAVMVGIGTVLADDPALTAREVGAKRQPARVIVDSRARTPLGSKVTDTTEARTLIAVTASAPAERRNALEERGIEIVEAGAGDRVDLLSLLEALGQREVTSVLAEGGPTVTASLLEQGLADKLVFYLAPKVVGGRRAPGPVGGEGPEAMSMARAFEIDAVEAIEPDLKITAYPSGG
jgi:diaminohydroxyphosphoribosylaminopyrimidine deaminase/5-amino-6-(5-phosphoribosylamino)uracil reductase